MKVIENPNREIVNNIRKMLSNNGNQCPCVPESEWSELTKCPCKKFRETKECCCGLYIKVEE